MSVILPVRNASKYASRILAMILANIESNDEVLIIDDYSDDNTFDLYSNLGSRDRRIRVLRNPTPGLANALNFGIESSKHEWIARFDSDDVYPNNRLKVERTFIEETVSCIFTDYKVIRSDSTSVCRIPSAIFDPCIRLSFIQNARTPHPSVLFNKKMAVKVGGYKQENFPAEDLGLWLEMAKLGRVVSVPEELLIYTVHPTSVSSQKQSLMLSKRHALTHEFEFFHKCFEDVTFNWRDYFKQYNSVAQSNERKILLVLDYLRVAQRFNFRCSLNFFLMLIQLLRAKGIFKAVIKIALGKYNLSRARSTRN